MCHFFVCIGDWRGQCGLIFWLSWGQGRGWGWCFLDICFIRRGTSSTKILLNAMLARRISVWVGGYPSCVTMSTVWEAAAKGSLTCRVTGKSILWVKLLNLFETQGGTADVWTGWRKDVRWFHRKYLFCNSIFSSLKKIIFDCWYQNSSQIWRKYVCMLLIKRGGFEKQFHIPSRQKNIPQYYTF